MSDGDGHRIRFGTACNCRATESHPADLSMGTILKPFIYLIYFLWIVLLGHYFVVIVGNLFQDIGTWTNSWPTDGIRSFSNYEIIIWIRPIEMQIIQQTKQTSSQPIIYTILCQWSANPISFPLFCLIYFF